MSKLIDKLEKMGEQAPSPLGFGAAARRNNLASQIMLIGRTTPDALAQDAGLSEAQVDAIMVLMDSWEEDAVNRAADSLHDKLWGLRLSAVSAEQAALLKEKGCDFVAFEPRNTAAAVLNDEDLGKLIVLDGHLDENTARAIHTLPIDGTLYSPASGLQGLTVQQLIEIQQARSMVDKPFLIESPVDLGTSELQAIRNAEIAALVVDLSSLEAVAKLKEAISNLPRRKPRSRSREAAVPHVHVGFGLPGQDGEQEEEEEEDY